MHRERTFRTLWLVSGLALLVGCLQNENSTTTPPTAVAVDGSRYLLTSEPADSQGVIQARVAARDQEEIVVVGRIGGSATPWVEGRAAFSIVDLSLKSCAECGSDDCPKPWDYC